MTENRDMGTRGRNDRYASINGVSDGRRYLSPGGA